MSTVQQCVTALLETRRGILVGKPRKEFNAFRLPTDTKKTRTNAETHLPRIPHRAFHRKLLIGGATTRSQLTPNTVSRGWHAWIYNSIVTVYSCILTGIHLWILLANETAESLVRFDRWCSKTVAIRVEIRSIEINDYFLTNENTLIEITVLKCAFVL